MYRRKFLKQSALISLAPTLPTFLARTTSAATEKQTQNDRILVVIQLDGGNDGINTVVPFKDEGYAKHRKDLRLPEKNLIKLTDEFAFHPRLRSASQLFEDGRLSVVHGVGYPNPNRSHFESMAIWHAASTDEEHRNSGNGWLGDAISQGKLTAGPHAIHVGHEALPVALRGRRCTATTVSNAADLHLRLNVTDQSQSKGQGGTLTDFLTRSVSEAYTSAKELEDATKADNLSSAIPNSRLGTRLKLVSQMIKSNAAARVYYTQQDGYDTHAGQLPTHANLLGELSSSLKAFMDDLKASGLEDRVMVMAFSEFGRRVKENASIGTDHGTAGPVFLAGTKLAKRSYGELPSLMDLDGGDLKFNVDFRGLYASLLNDWLGMATPPALSAFAKADLLAPMA